MPMNTSPPPPYVSRIAFWLVPAEPNRILLEEIINRLADEYNAPRFMPHITLWVTHLRKEESPQQIVEAATRGVAPLRLEATGLDQGPDRFKSIFIRFDTESVVPLSRALGSSCKYPANYKLDAHLSLLYQHLSPVERNKIIFELQLPELPMHFDTVVATTPGRGQADFENVSLWQRVALVRLQPPIY
ncbi:MAG: hypothetical protein ACN4GW_12315 [Desulforhopalus sp.]